MGATRARVFVLQCGQALQNGFHFDVKIPIRYSRSLNALPSGVGVREYFRVFGMACILTVSTRPSWVTAIYLRLLDEKKYHPAAQEAHVDGAFFVSPRTISYPQ